MLTLNESMRPSLVALVSLRIHPMKRRELKSSHADANEIAPKYAGSLSVVLQSPGNEPVIIKTTNKTALIVSQI